MLDVVLYYFLAACLGYFLLRRLVLERFEMPMQGKYVFVTGCDSGFGRLLVIKLASKGVNVFAGCYTQQGVDELRKKEISSWGRLYPMRLDVTDEGSVEDARRAVERILEEEGAVLSALVNNAGIFTTFGPDDWCGTAEYAISLDVNTLGAIRVCHSFVPLLKKSKGRIVTMGSTAGRLHGLYVGPYVTAKFAVEAYMDCLRLELRPFGVSVHILEPGAFKTELLSESAQKSRIQKIWNSLPSNTKAEYGEMYRENFEVAWQMGVNVVANPNLFWVVDSYIHAIFALWPRLRYSPGWDAIFLFVPISVLPTSLQDLLLTGLYALHPGPRLLPAALACRRRETNKSPWNFMMKTLTYATHLAMFPIFCTAFLIRGMSTKTVVASGNHTVAEN
ncbi:unnamed protein product [Caenorhabditis auriculariae]|uniref:Uncharacterized protein n=1 Tax=Caenorhabditis auriculariae TaxID=2777116 RepID=A0A8S1HN93_9PELO|nr:unnamed protein product [Caenorhabditis auriculariae]